MRRLRKHFADWLDSKGLEEVKERLRTCATSVLGEGIDGVLFTLPRLGTFKAVECDLTGCVRGARWESQQYITVTADYNEDGIEWELVR